MSLIEAIGTGNYDEAIFQIGNRVTESVGQEEATWTLAAAVVAAARELVLIHKAVPTAGKGY